MRTKNQQLQIAILKILRDADGPLGSLSISRALRTEGHELSPRTLRLHLGEMEKEELVEEARRGRSGGRSLTPRGREKIQSALSLDRVSYIASQMDAIAWKMDFNPATETGRVVMNVSLIDTNHRVRALDEMRPVFEAGLGMGNRLVMAHSGEQMGDFRVPKGRSAIGTVCSVSLHGLFQKAGIPSYPRFGGVLELEGHLPIRFTDIIAYDGTSLDPAVIFIDGGRTSVRNVSMTGTGRICASFREFPTATQGSVSELLARLKVLGMDGVIMVGKPDQSLLGFPVTPGRTGMIVLAGLNPLAAIKEAGMAVENHALSALFPYEKTIPWREARRYLSQGVGA